MDLLQSFILNNRPERKRFTILINSSGGDPMAVVQFASFLRTLPESVRLHGYAFGECGSAALALLQCCHKRIAVRHCAFTIHHINSTLKLNCHHPNPEEEVSRQLAQSRSIEDELVALQCKRTGISRKKWMRLADEGESSTRTLINTKRARKLGLVDKVVNRAPFF